MILGEIGGPALPVRLPHGFAGLGGVQGGVGTTQQDVGVFPVVRKHGDPDAEADAHGAPLQVERRRDRLRQASEQSRQRLHAAQVLDRENELVPAQARDKIGPAHAVVQAHAGLAQDDIARVVPEAVVHRLEVVEVQQADGKRRAAAAGARQGMAEMLLEQQPVGQAGQRIVPRQVELAAAFLFQRLPEVELVQAAAEQLGDALAQGEHVGGEQSGVRGAEQQHRNPCSAAQERHHRCRPPAVALEHVAVAHQVGVGAQVVLHQRPAGAPAARDEGGRIVVERQALLHQQGHPRPGAGKGLEDPVRVRPGNPGDVEQGAGAELCAGLVQDLGLAARLQQDLAFGQQCGVQRLQPVEMALLVECLQRAAHIDRQLLDQAEQLGIQDPFLGGIDMQDRLGNAAQQERQRGTGAEAVATGRLQPGRQHRLGRKALAHHGADLPPGGPGQAAPFRQRRIDGDEDLVQKPDGAGGGGRTHLTRRIGGADPGETQAGLRHRDAADPGIQGRFVGPAGGELIDLRQHGVEAAQPPHAHRLAVLLFLQVEQLQDAAGDRCGLFQQAQQRGPRCAPGGTGQREGADRLRPLPDRMRPPGPDVEGCGHLTLVCPARVGAGILHQDRRARMDRRGTGPVVRSRRQPVDRRRQSLRRAGDGHRVEQPVRPKAHQAGDPPRRIVADEIAQPLGQRLRRLPGRHVAQDAGLDTQQLREAGAGTIGRDDRRPRRRVGRRAGRPPGRGLDGATARHERWDRLVSFCARFRSP